jgi:hypothetical protein
MSYLSRCLGGAAATVVILGFTVGIQAETWPLEMRRTEAPTEGSIFHSTHSSYTPQSIDMVNLGGRGEFGFADLIHKEPEEYRSESPVRGVISLGDSEFGYVLDLYVDEVSEDRPSLPLSSTNEASSEPLLYARLYIDHNQNGDLTDDEVVQVETTDFSLQENLTPPNIFKITQPLMPVHPVAFPAAIAPPATVRSRLTEESGAIRFNLTFPPIEFTIDVEGRACEYACFLNINGDAHYGNGSIRAASYREGEITLAGKKHRVILIDYNSNGRFDDQLSLSTSFPSSNSILTHPGDRLYIDPDLSNRSRNAFLPGPDEDQYEISQLICIDDRFYEISVSPRGDQLTLEPYDKSVGWVSNLNENYRAVVYSDLQPKAGDPRPGPYDHVVVKGDQGFVNIIGDESGRALLPVGEWKLLSCAIGKTDRDAASGVTCLSARATRACETFEVIEGETIELPFGGPYRPQVEVEMGTEYAYLKLSLIGAGGEECYDIQNEGEEPDVPKITITTSGGEIVEEGEFAKSDVYSIGYRGRSYLYRWRPPSELADEYRVYVQVDGGLFGIDEDYASILQKSDFVRDNDVWGLSLPTIEHAPAPAGSPPSAN